MPHPLNIVVTVSVLCSRKLQEAFYAESGEYEPAFPSQGRVNIENWVSLVGVDVLPPGPPDFSKPKEATHYADFIQFFSQQIEEKGVTAVMKMVSRFPFLPSPLFAQQR